MPELPLEIIYLIADFVSSNHPETLQALSLTSKSLVPCCQQHIFAQIKIWDGPLVAIVYPDRRAHTFAKLITRSFRIASYVRELTIQLPTRISFWITENARETVFKALKQIPNLNKLSLRSTKCYYSSIFNNTVIASSITHLLGLKTLTTLHLTGLLGISPSLFSFCPTIRRLMISGTVSAIKDEPKHTQIPISLSELHLYMDFGHYQALKSLFDATIDGNKPVIDLSEMKVFRTSRTEISNAAIRDLVDLGMSSLEDFGLVGVNTATIGLAHGLKPAAKLLKRLYFSYINGNLGSLVNLFSLSQPF
ncbi:hypothetical protein CPB83DRAFT_368749 [Crepidotus variabilis]|uniref:F-box domain-containing protein n=1 Tax=Crepidotus variabilis TaxID=179855 RepID=A0A9P6EF85_9AGAR|nr:hypothetical protein CPB83DRAFT_368749 [Crepidotus variabilis]